MIRGRAGRFMFLTKKVIGGRSPCTALGWKFDRNTGSHETIVCTKRKRAAAGRRKPDADATCMSNKLNEASKGGKLACRNRLRNYLQQWRGTASFSHSQKKLLRTQFIFVVHCNHEAWSALMPFMHHRLTETTVVSQKCSLSSLTQACCLLTTITTFYHITFHFYTHAALGCLEYKVSYLANGFIILSAPEINARKRFMSSMVLAFWVVNFFCFLSLTQISLQVFYYSGENEGRSFFIARFWGGLVAVNTIFA